MDKSPQVIPDPLTITITIPPELSPALATLHAPEEEMKSLDRGDPREREGVGRRFNTRLGNFN